MKLTIKENRELIMVNARNTQNENDVETLQITVPEKYEDFYKKIVFITDDGVVWDLIENDTYTIKRAITKYDSVKFYIWLTKDEQDFRSVEKTLYFNKNHEVDGEIEPEEQSAIEHLISIVESEITEVNEKEQEITDLIDNIQDKLDNGDFNGQAGTDGQNGFSPTIRTIETTDGYDLEITDISGTNTITILNGKNGINGQDGQNGKDGEKGEKRRPWTKR